MRLPYFVKAIMGISKNSVIKKSDFKYFFFRQKMLYFAEKIKRNDSNIKRTSTTIIVETF